jgi:4a-hydroxytetrahydrobiopterin dehydratase
MATTDGITSRDFYAAEDTGEWRILGDGATTFYRTASYAESARLVDAISRIEGLDDHPVDLDIRVDGVTARLVTYTDDYYGMTRRDIAVAQRITAAARDLGFRGDPMAVESVGPIVVGAVDIPKVMPFWEALLGYVKRTDSPAEDLVDPRGRGPGVWFEEVSEPGGGRPRMHVAVWVPPEQAEARVQAALAAGGTMVFEEAAPAWWTLADPEGNEADVATIKGRD